MAQYSPRIWLLASLLYFTSLFYLLFQGGKTSLMLFVFLNVLAVYLLLGRWSGIASVRGSRVFSNGSGNVAFLTAGQSLEVGLRIHIPGFWPMPYVIVKETLARVTSGEDQQYEMSFVPDYRRNGQLLYRTGPLRRGTYQFAETSCATKDIFGLFEHRGVFLHENQVHVLPQTVELKDWQLHKYAQRGANQRTYASQWARETTQIDGVREYIHGDRLSRVHWTATARTGQWKSKEYEREALPRIVIVLDRAAASYRSEAQFELAVSVSASLLSAALRLGMPVGFVSAGKQPRWFGEGREPVSREVVLRHLIGVEPDGEQSVGVTLCQAADKFESGVFLALVTGSLQLEQADEAYASFERKHIQPGFVHVQDRTPRVGDEQKLTYWRDLCEAREWQFHSLAELDQLPQAFGEVSSA